MLVHAVGHAQTLCDCPANADVIDIRACDRQQIDPEEHRQLLKQWLCGLLITACFVVSAFAQTHAPEHAVPLTERLGTDDGFAAAILISSNLRGNLLTCDCNYPRGGLARRIGYLETFKGKFKDVTLLQVEAGQFWYNPSQNRLIALQNEQVTRAYSRWPMDVINLSRFDLLQTQWLLEREGLAERTKTFPMIQNLISANGVFNKNVVAPPPYLIKEITGPRIKGKKNKLRIGFVGLAEPIRPSGGVMDATVLNLFESARRVVPRVRKECDVLVIVAHASMEAATRLAQENPEADVIISGEGEGLFKPRQIGHAFVVAAAPGNTQQGDLRLYLDKEGRVSFKYLSIDLDAGVPSDPDAEAFATAASRERERARFNQ
jgi:2',3'-cyclic-nucleotide 2'-phosphodiesterase (5'-nucleotidase family)